MSAFIDIQPVATNNNNAATALLLRTQNVSMITHIRPANANEIASFPTAASAVFVNSVTYFQPTTVTILTAQTVAALKTLIAA